MSPPGDRGGVSTSPVTQTVLIMRIRFTPLFRLTAGISPSRGERGARGNGVRFFDAPPHTH